MRALFAISLIAICLVACVQERDSYIVKNHPDKNFEKFYRNVHEWPYTLEPKRTQRIIGSYADLNIGSGLEKTKGLLGQPDVIDTVHQSNNLDKKITSWLYVLKMSGPLIEGGIISSAVVVYFDESGRLIATDITGIGHATPIGDVATDKVGRYVRYWN